MGLYFYPTLEKQIQPLSPLKSVSKIGNLSLTIVMTAHCFGAQLDTVWLVKSVTYLTWLAKLVGVALSSSIRKTNFPRILKPWNSRASVG